MIFIAADHGGFNLKQEIVSFLKKEKKPIKDLGAKLLVQQDNYPEFAFKLTRQVVKRKSNLGILICRNGIGMTVAANKVRGIRAGLVSFVGQAVTARAHDNCNVLVLPADFIDAEKAISIVRTFLAADFSREERHVKRLEKIEEHEKKVRR